jgi:hypothetical protein
MLEAIQNRLKRIYNAIFKSRFLSSADDDQGPLASKERFVVFLSAYILALAFWFAVNVNREYSLSINMPIEIEDLPAELALREQIPEAVAVSVNADWWQLASIFNKPPTISLQVSEDGEVNLFNEVRNEMSDMPQVRIDKVQPSIIEVNLEEKAERKIPVRLRTEISFQEQFGMVGKPSITPDSVVISGAASVIGDLNAWVVEEVLTVENAKEDIDIRIRLESTDPLISLSSDELRYRARVSEFTEGEKVVFITTRGLPRNQNIAYNPSSLTIRYNIPIEEYATAQEEQLFEVFVPYRKIIDDSTGFVTPDIEIKATELNIRVRDFLPKTIGYFVIVEE